MILAIHLLSGFEITATEWSFGTISWSSSSHLPVILPGCLL